MNAIRVYAKLSSLRWPLFSTRDAAAICGMTIKAASKALSRFAAEGLLTRMVRGFWVVIPDRLSDLSLAEPLIGMPSYVSLLSALSFHGMITQVPQDVYSMTVGRSRKIDTPEGVYAFHHCEPDWFFGFDLPTENPWLKIATPEKALLDVFYLRRFTRRLEFSALPEVDLPKGFSWNRLRSWAKRKGLLAHVDDFERKQAASEGCLGHCL
ncbi:type IV toxin-antitoxin system AbiEi family antitoxin domain-containing protein [Verrucomicrobium sp. 3C]|uniref:type IV toxin-antitoxin system AbiEi family antitoxin domain-containing protein n=1 Tax=Verrucomicrobium sp. 3C TaxID=1134055 RepID=UPI0003611EAB|nr:type IV toxin-antitoxin system AbiEi family antitoxin domain-containing protein [Verrucomicrobium sp. 3C]